MEENIKRQVALLKHNKMTVKDLLPILEKSNAYGLTKFKELIKF